MLVDVQTSWGLRAGMWMLAALVAQGLQWLIGYPVLAVAVVFAALDLARSARVNVTVAALIGAAFAAVPSAFALVLLDLAARAVEMPLDERDVARDFYLPMILLAAGAGALSALLEQRRATRSTDEATPLADAGGKLCHILNSRTKQLPGLSDVRGRDVF